MPAIVNIPDFLKIALMASVGIWLINKGLKAAGLQSMTA